MPSSDDRRAALLVLAQGPLFYACQRDGWLSDEYKAALAELGQVAEVHVEVKALAATIHALQEG